MAVFVRRRAGVRSDELVRAAGCTQRRRDENPTAVTADQVRHVVAGLVEAGRYRAGDPEITIVFDAGYEICRLAWLLTDLPVVLVGRVRSDRVFCFPPAPRAGGGRPARHGPVFTLADPRSHPARAAVTAAETARYGSAVATAWSRLQPRITRARPVDRPRGRSADHRRQRDPVESGPAAR